MKLSRMWTCSLASIQVFALTISGAHTNTIPIKNIGEPTCLLTKNSKKLIPIIIHGLMVGRYRKGGDKKKRFELGVVKRAPDHTFSLTKYVPNQGCSPISIPLKKNLVFEVWKNDNPIKRNIKMWHPEVCPLVEKDPATELKDLYEDSSHILDIEKRIHTGKLNRYKKTLRPVFFFHNGNVKTDYLTVGLEKKKVEDDNGTACWEPIGPIAEVVKVEIEVDADEELVLRESKKKEKNSKELPQVHWRLGYNDIVPEMEVRIRNLPYEHSYISSGCDVSYGKVVTSECDPKNTRELEIDFKDFLLSLKVKNASRSCGDESPSATHFQNYYYLVFKKDRPDRFELRNPYGAKTCLKITDKQNRISPFTVPPYKCGMVLVASDEIEIK